MDSRILTVIPTYNRAWSIKRAVDSVLNQTHKDSYVLVVDDCSTDNTEEVLTEYINNPKFCYIKLTGESTKLPSTGRNLGIILNKFKYIDFLDSDDEFALDKHQLQFEGMKTTVEMSAGRNNLTLVENSGTADYVAGTTRIIYKDREVVKGTLPFFFAAYYPNIAVPNSELTTYTSIFSGLFSTRIFEILGGFKQLRAGEDSNFFDRLFPAGFNIKFIDKVSYLYYKNHDSSTLTQYVSEVKDIDKELFETASSKFKMLKAKSIDEERDLFVHEINLNSINIVRISNKEILSLNMNIPAADRTRALVNKALS